MNFSHSGVTDWGLRHVTIGPRFSILGRVPIYNSDSNANSAEEQAENEETRRTRIAASIACHAAIKVNMPLEPSKIDWLLTELSKTEHPTACPHGRPIALRYSHKDIQRAFQRI